MYSIQKMTDSWSRDLRLSSSQSQSEGVQTSARQNKFKFHRNASTRTNQRLRLPTPINKDKHPVYQLMPQRTTKYPNWESIYTRKTKDRNHQSLLLEHRKSLICFCYKSSVNAIWELPPALESSSVSLSSLSNTFSMFCLIITTTFNRDNTCSK